MKTRVFRALASGLILGAPALVCADPARAAEGNACVACHAPPPSSTPGKDVVDAVTTAYEQMVARKQQVAEVAADLDQLLTQKSQSTYTVNFPHWVATAPADPAVAGLDATLQPLEESLRTQLGLAPKSGLLVASVVEDGASAKAGLKANDILLTLADAPLAEPADLPRQLKVVGEKDAPLKLLRAGKPMTLRVRPVARMTLGPAEPEKVSFFIGVSASPPDDVLRAHVKLPDGQGLLVTEVVPESPAEKVGVKKHDILLKLNDTPLDRTETLSAQVQLVAGKPAPLLLLRSGQSVTLQVKPEPRKVAAETSPGPVYLWSTTNNAYHNPEGVRYYPSYDRIYSTQKIHGDVNVNSGTAITTPTDGARPAPAPTSATAKRVEELETEIKALRKAIEGLRDSLKKDK